MEIKTCRIWTRLLWETIGTTMDTMNWAVVIVSICSVPTAFASRKNASSLLKIASNLLVKDLVSSENVN